MTYTKALPKKFYELIRDEENESQFITEAMNKAGEDDIIEFEISGDNVVDATVHTDDEAKLKAIENADNERTSDDEEEANVCTTCGVDF